MRILALITARGGSKRIPGKNLRPLGGRPLIAWSIDVVKDIPEICDLLVSTDDQAIADVARRGGALVPWLRPLELATDTAGSVDVALHALDRYEADYGPVDGLLLLQPTTPFRSRDTVVRGITLFREHGHRPVFGVSPAESHPQRCFRIEELRLRPFLPQDVHPRSQDLPPAYVENGVIYLIAPDELRRRRSFFTEDAVPLVIDEPQERVDIDTEWDWNVAEAILRATV